MDPNTFSDDGTVALSNTAFSEDGKTFAYGLSTSGSDWIEIKFLNVETGENYKEVLKKVKYSSLTWMHDNKGFFYGVSVFSVILQQSLAYFTNIYMYLYILRHTSTRNNYISTETFHTLLLGYLLVLTMFNSNKLLNLGHIIIIKKIN